MAASIKKRKSRPVSREEAKPSKGDDDALLDQLLEDDTHNEGAASAEGCCGGGGCGPKLTKEDKERLAKARALYHEQKAKDAAEAGPPTPIRDFFVSLAKILLIGCLLVSFLYLKSGAEQYAQDRSIGDHLDTNPYQTLGIKPSAPLREIRKSYRNLSKQWHPDRNPGCLDVCEEKMNAINEAYQILSDPEKKRAYDKGKVVIGDSKIESHFSVDLTPEKYNIALASLNDLTLPIQPIVLQVYDPQDEMSQSFAKVWESTAESLSHMHIPFVRINAKTQPDLVKKLPINIKIIPTVLMLERNKTPQILPLALAREPRTFRSWIEENIGPQDMVEVARNAKQLKDWAKARCVPRKAQDLPVFDDRARLVVVTQSGRPTPSAVVNRVALQFNSVADVLYASPRAIPPEWRDAVDIYANNLILLPKCDSGKTDEMPLKVLGFGKSSYNDFYTNVSYLLSHRALPLTRKTADALCTSTVMGAPKRICHTHLIEEADSGELAGLEALANETALTRQAFRDMYRKAKEGARGPEDDDEDDEKDSGFQAPLMQNVYVFAHKGDSSCKCNSSKMSQLLNSQSEDKCALVDLTSGFVKPSTKKVNLTEKVLSEKLLAFSSASKSVSPCLNSTQDFMNQCLVPGETTQFMQMVHYFQDYLIVDWVILCVALGIASFLAMNMTAAQWCLALFVSPMLVQGYTMIADFMSYGGVPDFDEL